MVSAFDTPLKKKPHELTDLNGASKVNYSYRSSGDTKPSGNSLLESYLVTNTERRYLDTHGHREFRMDGGIRHSAHLPIAPHRHPLVANLEPQTSFC